MSNDKTIDQSTEEPGLLHRFRVGLQGFRNASVDFVSDTVGVVLGAGAGVGSVIVDQTAELFGGDVYEGTGFKSGWDSGNDAAQKLNQGLHWVIDKTAPDNVVFGKVKMQDSTDQTILDWSEGITTAGTFLIGGVGLAGKAGKGAKLTSAIGKGSKFSLANFFRSSANAAGKYGDDAAKAVGKYADDAAKAAGKYGDDAAKAAREAGKNAGKSGLSSSDRFILTKTKIATGATTATIGTLALDQVTGHHLVNGVADMASSDLPIVQAIGNVAEEAGGMVYDGWSYLTGVIPNAASQAIIRYLENTEKISPDSPDYEMHKGLIQASAHLTLGNHLTATNILLEHGIDGDMATAAWNHAKEQAPDADLKDRALIAFQYLKKHAKENMVESKYGVAGELGKKAKEEIEETKKDVKERINDLKNKEVVKETLEETKNTAQEHLAELQNFQALSGKKLSGLFNRVDEMVDNKELDLGADAGQFKNYSKLAGLFNTIGGFLSFIPGVGDFVKNIGEYFQKQALDIAKGAISQGGDRFNLTKDIKPQNVLTV